MISVDGAHDGRSERSDEGDEAERLVVENLGPKQEVTITAHAASELLTPAFDDFLVKAVASHGRIGKTGSLVMASELS